MSERKDESREKNAARQAYQKPQLKRWGTLRELTRGGGGTRAEPVTKRRTRF